MKTPNKIMIIAIINYEQPEALLPRGRGEELGSVAGVDVTSCEAGSDCGGLWPVDFAGLQSVTGLQTPELSSGQRKTSIGPLELFREIW